MRVGAGDVKERANAHCANRDHVNAQNQWNNMYSIIPLNSLLFFFLFSLLICLSSPSPFCLSTIFIFWSFTVCRSSFLGVGAFVCLFVVVANKRSWLKFRIEIASVTVNEKETHADPTANKTKKWWWQKMNYNNKIDSMFCTRGSYHSVYTSDFSNKLSSIYV